MMRRDEDGCRCINCSRGFDRWFLPDITGDDLCRDCAETYYGWCDECQAWWVWYDQPWTRDYHHVCGDNQGCTECGQVAMTWDVPEGYWCERCMSEAGRLPDQDEDSEPPVDRADVGMVW